MILDKLIFSDYPGVEDDGKFQGEEGLRKNPV
jgi:hypothetical protein